jgi:hypothetical protein
MIRTRNHVEKYICKKGFFGGFFLHQDVLHRCTLCSVLTDPGSALFLLQRDNLDKQTTRHQALKFGCSFHSRAPLVPVTLGNAPYGAVGRIMRGA